MRQNKHNPNHLSVSQINSFNNCEAKWYFNKVLKMKAVPSGAMTLGSAFDDSMNYNFIQKIKSKLDVKADIVVDVFDTSFNQRKDYTYFGADDKNNVREVGRNIVIVYMKQIAPHIQPAEVQKEYETQFENVEWTFVTRPDLITNKGTLIDNKTTGRAPKRAGDNYIIPQNDLLQMQSYEIAVNEAEKQKIKNSMLIYAVKKSVPEVVRVPVPELTVQDVKYFRTITALIYQRMQMIRSDQIAPKPNRLSMNCSRKWCGFWNDCEKMYGGKVKE